MDITGIIKQVGETQQVSDKFRKREFVLTDASSQYPQHISFQCTQDKCVMLDNLAVGKEVKVHFNLRGREWTSPTNEVKYFNTLECWRLDVVNEEANPNITYQKLPDPVIVAPQDDLPF